MLLLFNTSLETDSAALSYQQNKIATVLNSVIDIIPFCASCGEDMASIPYTLQMTKAMKKNQKAQKGQKQSQYYDSCMGAENPTRYSSKMMNSIWGQYNELSVHNIKSLQCGGINASTDVQEHQSLQQTQQMQQQQQSGAEQNGMVRQLFGELGQAVSTNFMDNMHQY